MSQEPSNNPWADQQSQGQALGYHNPQSQQQYHYQQPPVPQDQNQNQNQNQTSQHPPRTEADRFLPQGQERSEQVETLQNYEARAPLNDDDKAQAQLQKEFPSLDSSLIAAIYGDTKDVALTREMLQELGTS